MKFDVIIVGGGPAGASTAIHLAAGGARVMLAEQETFPREKLCGEFISPECLGHFGRLGVLDEMTRAGGVEVSETIFYAASGRSVAVPSAWLGGTKNCALGLSRAEMDRRLAARARAAGVCVLEGATLSGLMFEGVCVRGVSLRVAGRGEEKYESLVTIDATGRQRVLARRAEREVKNSGRVRSRARFVAFKAHLEGASGAARACEIYFYRGGYGGLSPVEDGLSNLCFIARARDVRACGSDPERVMREVLMRNRRAAHSLAGARARGEWLAVALESFGRHDPVPAAGLLAVGDAAAFIDPFTGSGMLMALESGELAARAVSRWVPRARRGEADFDALTREYRTLYGKRFDARLRVCGALRRAAFAPPALAELAVLALGASDSARRLLARATRSAGYARP